MGVSQNLKNDRKLCQLSDCLGICGNLYVDMSRVCILKIWH